MLSFCIYRVEADLGDGSRVRCFTGRAAGPWSMPSKE